MLELCVIPGGGMRSAFILGLTAYAFKGVG